MFSALYRILANSMQILAAIKRIEASLAGMVGEQAAQRSLLERILAEVTPPPRAVRVAFNVTYQGRYLPGVDSMKIKDNQEFDVTLTFTDAGGNPASVDGAPQWTVDNTSALSVTPAADGLSAVVSANGPIGTGQVSVTADADLGAGTTEIHGVLDVEVIAGDASMVVLNPGAARDKAAP